MLKNLRRLHVFMKKAFFGIILWVGTDVVRRWNVTTSLYWRKFIKFLYCSISNLL